MSAPQVTTEGRPQRITAEWLRGLGACEKQVERFEFEWPDGCEVTMENALRAVALDLDIDWLASKLPSTTARRVYEEARATAWFAYDEATAPAWRAYEEARDTAWRAYDEATATAWRAYREATATAWRPYEEARATAWRAHQEAMATAFVAAWMQS